MWASPLVRRSGVERVTSFLRGSSSASVSLQANYPVSFLIPYLPWDPPLGAHSLLGQDGS